MYIIIALVTALLTALWGWKKGFFRLVLRLSALLLAYALAWQEAPTLAAYMTDKGWLSGVLVWPVASLVLFFVGSLIFSLAARGLLHIAPEHWQKNGKLVGGLCGAVLGCGLGLLLVWTTGAMQDALNAGGAQQKTTTSSEESALAHADQMLRDVSGSAMATMAKGALGDGPEATAAAQWIRNPLSMSEGLQHLASKPELQQLFRDPANYAVLVRGTINDIQRLPAFQALTDDPQVMQLLSVAGLPGEGLAQQSQALAGMLSRYAGNFEKMRATPEFKALAEDADLRQKLQQGNLLVLLTDDKMRRLASMISQGDAVAGETPEGLSTPSMPEKNLPEKSQPPKKLYQWKDEKGRVHITEEKPPEGVETDVIQL